MNKYAATGILIDALDGKRFVVVERSYREVKEAVAAFAEAIEACGLADVARVRRANGAERVSIPGRGCVIFATPFSNRMRGLSVDVVFIDNDAHRLEMDSWDDPRIVQFREDVAIVLSTAKDGGKVIHS